MKIIFSRKGFDSGSGGGPNPILPGGRLLCLPIPDRDSPIAYGDIGPCPGELGDMVSQLTRARIDGNLGAHLDPDLDPRALARSPGWRPIFGQTGASLTHLVNHGVGAGDLFLFFAWFREAERHKGRWRFLPGALDRHILYGWLQVARVVAIPREGSEGIEPNSEIDDWMRYHPHFFGSRRGANALFVARSELELPGVATPGEANRTSGAGLFASVAPRLILTAAGEKRSIWRLPAWFHPHGRGSCLSYHRAPKRWTRDGERLFLRAAYRGQEFVLDCADYPEAIAWTARLFEAAPQT